MKKTILAIIGLLVLGTFFVYRDQFRPATQPGQLVGTIEIEDVAAPESIEYTIEEVASNLEIPWGLAFTGDDRILVTERPGRLRVIENGSLLNEPLHQFTDVATNGEAGLMSVLLDPDYEDNKWIYISYTHPANSGIVLRVSRFKDNGDSISEETILIDNIPAARFHAGSRLAFGPDGKLYITTGDATDRPLAQNLDSLAGKTLRINKDGTIPSDNPFEDSPIWSYGHRNSQGIDWHPETGEPYSSEHGPSVFDGPPGGDEVNRIIKGANYGWPLVSHEETIEGSEDPIAVFTPAEAPASMLAYSGKAIPQFKNNLFFGALRGEGIIRMVLDEQNPDEVLFYEKMEDVQFGRIREVMEGPDGFIYFTTSNQDGRGDPALADDRILRIRTAN